MAATKIIELRQKLSTLSLNKASKMLLRLEFNDELTSVQFNSLHSFIKNVCK
jgi:hypothetical protein